MAEEDPWARFDRAGPGAAPAGAVPADPYARFAEPTLTPSPPPGSYTAEVRAAPDDKYRAEAIRVRDKLLRAGVSLPEGYTSRVGMGAGLGWLDELVAAAGTPFEMVQQRTLNPAEAYRYAKAKANLTNEMTRQNTAGALGTVAEIAGGLGTAGAAIPRAGMAAMRLPFTARTIPGTGNVYGRGAVVGGGIGTVAGAGDAPDIASMPSGMLMGGVFGTGVGAAAPAVVGTIAQAARTLQLPRLLDPQRVATAELEQVARRAGVPIEEVERRVADAQAAGQPYTVADALGHEGQRKLAALGKVPGGQRELIQDTLSERALNRPVRTGAEIGRAFGAPGTSEAAREALIEQARTQSAPLYRAAEDIPTWSARLQIFLDDPIARQGIRRGDEIQRLRARGEGREYNPRDAMITGVDEAGDPIITGVPNMQTLNTLKVGLDEMIRGEQNEITGRLTNRGAALTAFREGMLREMDTLNPAYARARATYGGPMRIEEAVRVGQQLPFRGRYEDTMQAFRALPPAEQQGVRIGYADAVRGPLERTGNYPSILRQKSQKGAAELDTLSLEQGPRQPEQPSMLRRFLNREEEMQRGEKAALGGSPTAENLADIADTPGIDVLGLTSAAARGDPLGFTQHLWGAAKNIVGRGQSEAQRVAITRALLEQNPDAIRQMAERIRQRAAQRSGSMSLFGPGGVP